MYIRVKINNSEVEFDNKQDGNRALVYRTHNDKSQDKLSEEILEDIFNLITHMAKEIRENND